MNVGKYVQMYSEDLRLKNYGDLTIKNYTSQVKLFLEYFDKKASKTTEIYTHVSTQLLSRGSLSI